MTNYLFQGSQYPFITITGLLPDTTYKYWVQPSANTVVFSKGTFCTMPESGPFTFIVPSDSHASKYPDR